MARTVFLPGNDVLVGDQIHSAPYGGVQKAVSDDVECGLRSWSDNVLLHHFDRLEMFGTEHAVDCVAVSLEVLAEGGVFPREGPLPAVEHLDQGDAVLEAGSMELLEHHIKSKQL